MSRLTVGSIEGLTENSNVVSVPTGHSLNVADAGGLQIGGSAIVSAGLVHISRTTIGTAVSSVTVTDAFSSTFENYRIVGYFDSASTAAAGRLQLGVGGTMTTTDYYWGHLYVNTGGTVGGTGGSNDSQIGNITVVTVNGCSFVIDVMGPNLARRTNVTSVSSDTRTTAEPLRYTGGFANNNTQFTSFLLSTASGTFTGGIIDVYGYAGA